MNKLNFQEQSLVYEYKKTYSSSNENYIYSNFLIKQIFHDYLSNILIHKPSDVFHFTQEYFDNLKVESEEITTQSFQPVIFVGDVNYCLLGGKVELINKLSKDFPNDLNFCVGYTTRKPRKIEKNGVHHYFISKDEMNKMIDRKEFYEVCQIGGNDRFYGTSKKTVDKLINQGLVCVFFMNSKGVIQFKSKWTGKSPITYYLKPESREKYEEELNKRNIDVNQLVYYINEYKANEKIESSFDEVLTCKSGKDETMYRTISNLLKNLFEKNMVSPFEGHH